MTSQSSLWDKEYSKRLSWNRQTLSLPKLLKGKSVLELGVGNGKTLLSILQQKPKSISAVDFSQESIDICISNPKFSKVEFILSDVSSLPFSDKSFDVVVCYYTLNALLENERADAINEIRRVLNPKGFVLFEDFGVGDFRQDNPKGEIEPNTIIKKNGIICHFFTKKDLKELFNSFKISKMSEKSFKPFKTTENVIRRVINFVASKS